VSEALYTPTEKEILEAYESIQYLRELAVPEVIYSDLDDDEVSKDPEDVLYTRAMWRKVIQGALASYSNSLAAMYCPDMDTPTVERVSSWQEEKEVTLRMTVEAYSHLCGMGLSIYEVTINKTITQGKAYLEIRKINVSPWPLGWEVIKLFKY